MTRRTRLFLTGASAVLVCGLGTGLVASYMGFQGLAILGSNGPDELAYVPADTNFLAFADVRDIMDSDVHQRLSALQPGPGKGAERFKTETGIDIERDIDYLIATTTVGEAQDTDPPKPGPPLLLARGRFDPVRIEGLVTEHGGRVEDYAGTRLLVQGDSGFAVAFVEPGLAAIGPAVAVRRAIDTKASGSDVRGNDALMGIVRDIDQGDAWAVARFDSLTASTLPAEISSQLPPITWFSATGAIGAGLEGQLRIEAREESGAQNLREVIRGFLALVRMQAGQQPGLAGLVDSLQLGGEGTTVSLSFSVPPELIDALAAMAAARRADTPEATPNSTPVRPAVPWFLAL